MKPKILNYGSLNIDHVYRVPHFVRPGETLSSHSLQRFAGGKGANQSVALARAGAQIFHAGKIGTDGVWLKEKLEQNGINTQFIREGTLNNGHAIIQVDNDGQNAIILYSGANREMEKEEIVSTLSRFDQGDYLLLQNEINLIPELIEEGVKNELHVCFNPAPMTPEVLDFPLDLCHLLVVNETEASALVQSPSYEEMLEKLISCFPKTDILLTVGKEGAYYASQGKIYFQAAHKVKAVDTTAAGDTFIGYFLAGMLKNSPIEEVLKQASKASALCISKEGAMDSIPLHDEVF